MTRVSPKKRKDQKSPEPEKIVHSENCSRGGREVLKRFRTSRGRIIPQVSSQGPLIEDKKFNGQWSMVKIKTKTKSETKIKILRPFPTKGPTLNPHLTLIREGLGVK